VYGHRLDPSGGTAFRCAAYASTMSWFVLGGFSWPNVENCESKIFENA
jgi:hypothetical protein